MSKNKEEREAFDDIGELSEIDLTDEENQHAETLSESGEVNNLEELKNDLEGYKRQIAGHIKLLFSHQDKRAYISRNALDLRAHIRDKKENILSEFQNARRYEADQKAFYQNKNKAEIKKERQATKQLLTVCFEEYQEALGELRSMWRALDNVDIYKDFMKTLERLQATAKTIPSDYRLFAVEHMQALQYAVSDVLHNISRPDVSEQMKKLWQGIQKVWACLFKMSNLLQKEQEQLHNSDQAFEVLDMSEQENIQMIDNGINVSFGKLARVRVVEAEEPRQINNIEYAVNAMQQAINETFADAKKCKITLTPVQHAALQALRAEGRRAIAHVTPSVADKARERFTSIKEGFKALVNQRSDKPEPEEDNSEDNRLQ